MPKIGILVGRENTFPPAFIEHVNNRNGGFTAEYCLLGGSRIDELPDYAVIVDRMSHEVPYYRSYVKNAALNGTVVINDPFWFPADDKFIGSAIARRVGVAVPRTVTLPNHAYIEDVTSASLRNLLFPIPWEQHIEYTGLPAFLKPSVGGGWKHVHRVRSVEELIYYYDQSGQLPMILQEAIEFEQYVRCICFGAEHILPMRYNPLNPSMFERYEGVADASYLGADVLEGVVSDARALNQALGYTMNTVEFAIRDGIPYAIDFLNPVCDLDDFSIGPVAFEWAVVTLADLAIRYAQEGAPVSHSYLWQKAVGSTSPDVEIDVVEVPVPVAEVNVLAINAPDEALAPAMPTPRKRTSKKVAPAAEVAAAEQPPARKRSTGKTSREQAR
jgi:hypothetical protein